MEIENIISLIVSALSGLCVCIPLVYKLVITVQQYIREKNWTNLLALIMKYMAEAEHMFQEGQERKNYVIMAIQASASTLNYDIDMTVVSQMIDDLCSLSKIVNAPNEEIKAKE